MKNIFNKSVSLELIERINKLTPNTKAVWGKMNVSQMLAHLNIQYEFIYENEKFKKPNPILRFILKTFLKNKVVGETPFKKNGKTSPVFIITSDKDFNTEKERLINYISTTQKNGVEVLLPHNTKSFGKLTAKEWSNMLYKHLDHHLVQFGV